MPLVFAGLTLTLMLGMTKRNYQSGLGVISVIDVGQLYGFAVIEIATWVRSVQTMPMQSSSGGSIIAG